MANACERADGKQVQDNKGAAVRTRVVDLFLNDGNHLFIVLLGLRRHELILEKHGLV